MDTKTLADLFSRLQNTNVMDRDDMPIDCYEQSKILSSFNMITDCICKFDAGDFVRPKENTHIRGKNKPHKVLYVYPQMQYLIPSDLGMNIKCYDMIIAEVLPNKEIVMFAALSCDYEKFMGATVNDEL